MPSRKKEKLSEEPQAEEIGKRLRILIGNESITAFSGRLGISRQWLHDILSGRVQREQSIATLSSIADTLGYSLEWLVTGKGMPNDRWSAETALVSRLVPATDIRKKITLKKIDGELVLVPVSLLSGVKSSVDNLGVLTGQSVDTRPLIGLSDEILVDLADHALVEDGLFLVQVRDRLQARRAIRTENSDWLLSSDANSAASSFVTGGYRVLGRIRLIWKRA
jgi:transcriptional regulator with XRE-family HTH domain